MTLIKTKVYIYIRLKRKNRPPGVFIAIKTQKPLCVVFQTHPTLDGSGFTRLALHTAHQNNYHKTIMFHLLLVLGFTYTSFNLNSKIYNNKY